MSNTDYPSSFTIREKDGSYTLHLLVDGLHCPSCVAIIESALKKHPDVTHARLNLSTRRLKLTWTDNEKRGVFFIELLHSMGYRAVPFNPDTYENAQDNEEKKLLRYMAVAGFASGNLMLFSIPIWTSDSVSMGEITRNFFYWIQSIIALPAAIYSGLPFYRSAWNALRQGYTNMDVPISVAVLLTLMMSLLETITHGQHAYFDSVTMLLFFLLIGRYLDSKARGKARSAAHDLLKMMTGSATLLTHDGSSQTIPLSKIKKGMTLLVAAGEKIGADGEVISGISELDISLITGETIPQPVQAGTKVFAGTINMSAPLTILVTTEMKSSLLAEIIRLMEVAEQSQARYVSIADKISSWYTPTVHVLALFTFLGWWLYAGIAWQQALLYGATVLIITCPCALGLAVPVVQVLASGRLMRRGILLKSGSALERMASITHIVFDKTGTLTLGTPELVDTASYNTRTLQLAASIASQSKHPLSQALLHAYPGILLSIQATEIPGYGLEATHEGKRIRLGKKSWCGPESGSSDASLELWLEDGKEHTRFRFIDQLRPDAKDVIASLHASGLNILLYSGDRKEVVSRIAHELNISNYSAELSPMDKSKKIEDLKSEGAVVLMVGDGLNDAPSLASATVSISPSSAIAITQNAADIIFQGKKLGSVLDTWKIARFSQLLVKQNFILAMLYNLIAIPIAMTGYVTPLVAAIAMSSSSLIVIANAMRLNLHRKQG